MEAVHPLRRWRKDRSVTLAVLGEQAAVSPSHLSEIERGLNAPSLNLAARLSGATGGEVAVEEFVKREAAE